MKEEKVEISREEKIQVLRQKLIDNFTNTLTDQTIDDLLDLLEKTARENVQKNGGEQKCNFTLMPKFPIIYKTPNKFKVQCKTKFKEENEYGEVSEEEFTIGGPVQGELNMDGQNAEGSDESDGSDENEE